MLQLIQKALPSHPISVRYRLCWVTYTFPTLGWLPPQHPLFALNQKLPNTEAAPLQLWIVSKKARCTCCQSSRCLYHKGYNLQNIWQHIEHFIMLGLYACRIHPTFLKYAACTLRANTWSWIFHKTSAPIRHVTSRCIFLRINLRVLKGCEGTGTAAFCIETWFLYWDAYSIDILVEFNKHPKGKNNQEGTKNELPFSKHRRTVRGPSVSKAQNRDGFQKVMVLYLHRTFKRQQGIIWGN